MVKTTEMPRSIQSDLSPEIAGEALLKHYNLGITNPWDRLPEIDNPTYNRRKLPWAGKSFRVENGSVKGQDAGEVPQGLKDQWVAFAEEASNKLAGQEFNTFREHYDTLSTLNPKSTSRNTLNTGSTSK